MLKQHTSALRLSATHFFYFATLGAYMPFAGHFLATKQFSGVEIGLLLGVNPLCKFLFTSPWTLAFTRSKNRTRFLALTQIISALSPLFLLSNPGFWRVFLMVFFFTISRSGAIPVIDNLTMRYASRHGLEYGRIRMFGSLGFICSVVGVGYLMNSFGVDAIIPVTILLGLITVIPVMMLNVDDAAPKTILEGKLPLDRNTVLLFATLSVYATSFSFFNNFFNVKIDLMQLPQSLAGIAWGTSVGMEIVLMFVSAWLFRHYSARNLIIISLVAGFIRYGVLGWTESVPLLLVVNLLHGFTFGTFHISVLAYIRNTLPENGHLTAQSMYGTIVYGLGPIAGSWMSGVLFDYAGIASVFYSAAGISLVSAGFMFFCRNDRP